MGCELDKFRQMGAMPVESIRLLWRLPLPETPRVTTRTRMSPCPSGTDANACLKEIN